MFGHRWCSLFVFHKFEKFSAQSGCPQPCQTKELWNVLLAYDSSFAIFIPTAHVSLAHPHTLNISTYCFHRVNQQILHVTRVYSRRWVFRNKAKHDTRRSECWEREQYVDHFRLYSISPPSIARYRTALTCMLLATMPSI